MVKHIVLWKICENGTKEDKEKVAAQMSDNYEMLKKIFPEMLPETRIGLTYVGDYDLVLDAVFVSDEAMNRFMAIPEHMKVREYINKYAYGKLSLDYEF